MSELRGRLLLEGELVEGRLTIERERISAVTVEPAGLADPPVIAPGLIDLHVHGFGGCDPESDLAGMARALARAGTTAFQPTLFPGDPERLGQIAERAWAASEASNAAGGGACALGLHLEGPFVNPERAGALPPEAIVEPSVAALRAILGPASGSGRGVRTVTLAPELSGARELVDELVRCGVRVSLGHSSATAEQARSAARAGAVGATHLFNAMGPLHHRETGLAGFALSDAALHAELIGDLVHVGEDAVALALAARGPDGLCLVSDALPGAGTGCDVFHWHGREHEVRDGAAWFRPEGPGSELALTGSAIGQLEMVQRLVERGVLGAAEALRMASETPARALELGDELGRLAPGARADLLVLRGPGLALDQVWVAGRPLERS